MKMTIPARMTVTIRTTAAQTLTSISSCVRSRWSWNLLGLLDNVLLQYRCYKIIGTILCKQAIWALTAFCREMFRVLAIISISVVTCIQKQQNYTYQVLHFWSFSSCLSLRNSAISFLSCAFMYRVSMYAIVVVATITHSATALSTHPIRRVLPTSTTRKLTK